MKQAAAAPVSEAVPVYKRGTDGSEMSKVVIICKQERFEALKSAMSDIGITEIVVCKVPVETVVETAKKALYSGKIGDGKIFVYDVADVIKVRTGESGYDALQDVE